MPRSESCETSGRPARTRYRVRYRTPHSTCVELHPETGRSHQLRLHLRELGHPILGDDLYAPEPWRTATTRLCLHASRLWLVHPADGSPSTFRSPPPF